jgi:hypothetical protein
MNFNSFRILIKTGILVYGFNGIKENEGDESPPPPSTNYQVAIDKFISGTGQTNDTVSMGAIFHASKAIIKSDLFEHKDFEDLFKKIEKLLKTMKELRTKPAIIYSVLVEAFWPYYPKMVG